MTIDEKKGKRERELVKVPCKLLTYNGTKIMYPI